MEIGHNPDPKPNKKTSLGERIKSKIPERFKSTEALERELQDTLDRIGGHVKQQVPNRDKFSLEFELNKKTAKEEKNGKSKDSQKSKNTITVALDIDDDNNTDHRKLVNIQIGPVDMRTRSQKNQLSESYRTPNPSILQIENVHFLTNEVTISVPDSHRNPSKRSDTRKALHYARQIEKRLLADPSIIEDGKEQLRRTEELAQDFIKSGTTNQNDSWEKLNIREASNLLSNAYQVSTSDVQEIFQATGRIIGGRPLVGHDSWHTPPIFSFSDASNYEETQLKVPDFEAAHREGQYRTVIIKKSDGSFQIAVLAEFQRTKYQKNRCSPFEDIRHHVRVLYRLEISKDGQVQSLDQNTASSAKYSNKYLGYSEGERATDNMNEILHSLIVNIANGNNELPIESLNMDKIENREYHWMKDSDGNWSLIVTSKGIDAIKKALDSQPQNSDIRRNLEKLIQTIKNSQNKLSVRNLLRADGDLQIDQEMLEEKSGISLDELFANQDQANSSSAKP